MTRALVLAGVMLIDAVLVVQQPWRRAVVIGAQPAATPLPVDWQDPLAGLTADDVARGVWGLQREGQISPAHAEVLAPLLSAGAVGHRRIGEARMAVRREHTERLSHAAAAR